MGFRVITKSSAHMRDDDMFLQEHSEHRVNIAYE
jgi:hypothetical protein